MTPSKAIKDRCKDCCPDKKDRIQAFCEGCFLFNIKGSKLKAIKNYCKVYCLDNNRPDICTSPGCSLYSFRFGKNPNLKGISKTPPWLKT